MSCVTLKLSKDSLIHMVKNHRPLYDMIQPHIMHLQARPFIRISAKIFTEALKEYDPPDEVRSNYLEQAIHYTRAKVHETVDKEPYVSQETLQSRKSICEAPCDFLDLDNKRCTICGCFYKKKLTLKRESCPMGFWLAETDDE